MFQLKGRDVRLDKKGIPNYKLYTKGTLYILTEKLKVIVWKMIYHANSKHKKAVIGSVITHEVDFDTTNINTDKKTFHKDIIYQENNYPKCVHI